ncbi:MAG: hypothetical protein ACKPKO_32680, partial [Candidatus Fonsibacter sp.]
ILNLSKFIIITLFLNICSNMLFISLRGYNICILFIRFRITILHVIPILHFIPNQKHISLIISPFFLIIKIIG